VLATVAAINETLAEPVHLPGGGVGLSASIGVAHAVPGEVAPFELLRRAEISLRRAQAIGNRQWAEFDRHRDVADRRRATLASTMSGALEFGELTALWEPWWGLADRTIVGVSVRAAWDHPEYGRVDHAECLSLAERTGAAVPLAAWLIDVSCEQAKAWSDMFGDQARTVGVGLTISQVADPDLVSVVRSAIEKTEVRPDLLVVGIPTAALRSEAGDTLDNITVLTSMGVRVLIGEAGTTPMELTMLDGPVAAIQVAEPLVRMIAASGPTAHLARLMGAMVGSMRDTGMAVVVPGIHDVAEVDWWRSVGARAGCGPYYGAPMTEPDASATLARHLPPTEGDR
jgi:predicted signal transduction protein with EAL and GGDEF domain